MKSNSAHSEAVKFGAVEQFAENERNLFFDDTGSVVLHADFVFIFADGFDVYPDFGETLLASGAASSQASRELSTASLTVVSSALRGLSNPSRCRFLAKNSLPGIFIRYFFL